QQLLLGVQPGVTLGLVTHDCRAIEQPTGVRRGRDGRGEGFGHQLPSASRTVSSTAARSASSTIIARVPARINFSARPKAWLGVSGTLRLPICTARSLVTTGTDGINCLSIKLLASISGRSLAFQTSFLLG